MLYVQTDQQTAREFVFILEMTAPSLFCGGRHGRDRMVVGFTTTYAISVYHHWCWEFEPRSGRGVQQYVIKICQWLATGRWFSPGPPVSSTIKTDCHHIAEILLKVALNTIKPINQPFSFFARSQNRRYGINLDRHTLSKNQTNNNGYVLQTTQTDIK